MKAEIVKWADVPDGANVLAQGTMMRVIREIASDEDTRLLLMKYKKYEMEVNVFKHYLTAVADG